MSAIRNERGVGVAAAIFFVLILATMGYLALALAIEDLHGAAAHTDSERAFLAAQAGLDLGVRKFVADPAWTGVASPGKPVGGGAFTVTVTTTDDTGAPLTGGQRMIRSTGTVGTAVRSLRRVVSPGGAGGSATVFATGAGDAVSIQSQKMFINIANIRDSSSGPNNTWGSGGFNNSDNESGIFTTWGSTGLSGSVLTVEAALYGYVSGALTDDDTDVTVYMNNVAQGGAFRLTETILNTRVGSANKGYWYVDVTSARTWTLTDFAGDLELYVLNNKTGADDGRTLFLDAVGFRVTVSGGGGSVVAGSFKEVVL